MGNLLRLIGSVLSEISLHSSYANARRLLTAQAVSNWTEVGFDAAHPAFYSEFIASSEFPEADGSQASEPLTARDIRTIVRKRRAAVGLPEENPFVRDRGVPDSEQAKIILGRIGVNRAARDIQRIFSYIRGETATDMISKRGRELDDMISRVGFRSPLFKISRSGGRNADGPLPLAHFYINHVSRYKETELRRNLRLLILAEQAHVTGYINYRDTIPDYGFAAASLAVGQLYLIAIHQVGNERSQPYNRGRLIPELIPSYHLAFRTITEIAKRYIAKAIDVLKREREQNRNTFHLISEAYFNLGDLLLLRLAALHADEARDELSGALYGVRFTTSRGEVPPSPGDWHGEDLRRQIWENYQQGIILVQAEMDELFGRYRFPPDAFHAHRNVMDPTLHHRICKAARTRHAATRPFNHVPSQVASPERTGYDTTVFSRYWDMLRMPVLAL